jgi:hypothetical protein
VISWPSFIVTTANDVRMVTPDRETVIHSGSGIYYGLSWDATHILVLARSGHRKPGHPDIMVLSPDDFHVVDYLTGEFTDGHQIHCDGERVYVTLTAKNSIEVVELKENAVAVYNWTGDEEDKNHINSIWKDGSEFWVGYHNWHRPAEKGEFQAESLAVKVDATLSSVLESHTVGYGNHNIVRVGDELLICSSGSHEFIMYNLTDKKVSRKIDTGYWVRGIGVTKDYIVLGATSVSGDRTGRLTGDSEVYLLDRSTLATLDKKTLIGTGSIYELRLIGCEDYAHNGIEFPGRV